MARQDGLSQWTDCVSTNMPHLSKPQATVLALWSFGIACTRSCGRGTVATFLALLLREPLANLDQRLYEWCLEATDKAGSKRTCLDVTTCFVPLLGWIVRLWAAEQIALTLDASSLGEKFVVLAVCVVYRGCGIPVAWTILRADKKRGWRREWLRMLRLLRPAIPRAWTVLVLADRGLYARWLFRRIVRLGWHPFLRINQGCKFRVQGQAQFVWLSELVGEIGQRWRGTGTAFASKGCQLDCTLVAWWGEGHKEPWFVLTDLPPAGCDAQWYGLRSWCEQAFKCTKRGGWHWQQTQMREPARVRRLWLAMAVATLWMITIGSDLEVGPGETAPDLPDLRPLLGLNGLRRARRTRLFRLGWLWLLVQLMQQQPLPLPRRLLPEPWPDIPERLEPSVQHRKALCYAYM
jgi:Transposase DDE domain